MLLASGLVACADGQLGPPILTEGPPKENKAPIVDAGADRSAVVGVALPLVGTATDDGRPAPARLTALWVSKSGPGPVAFEQANALRTSARFAAVGVYTLELAVGDGAAEGKDTVVITVQGDENTPPTVSLGPDRTVALVDALTLTATATDDGRPGAGLRFAWAMRLGPGTASFDAPEAPSTTVRFSAAGRYVLGVEVSDGAASGSDELLVTVTDSPIGPVNAAPTVSAGPSGDVVLPGAFLLAGSAADDGLPDGRLITTWTQISGPAPARFDDATRPETRVRFDAPGTYVLHLTADDGALSATSDVVVEALPEPAVNMAPVVDVGADRAVTLPSLLALTATITDDGLPMGQVTLRWSQVAGPGTVSFGDPSLAQTSAAFPQAGLYVLRLSASDGVLSAVDELTVTVAPAPPTNQAPALSAGPDQSVTLPQVAQLRGVVSDDGLPVGSTLVVTWSVVSGPGAVSIAAPDLAATSATFTVAGLYVLRLTATDGALTAQDDLQIGVAPANTAPVVAAGMDQGITLPATAALRGSATDDNLPNGTLAPTWSRVSGPGTVTFTAGSSFATNASFSVSGTYVLRLTVSDGALSGSDDVGILVRPRPPTNQSPTVSAGAPQTLTLPAAASLTGSAVDDGLPAGSTLTVTWTRVSGPGTVTFQDASRPVTSATFSAAGTYVLRLTATDGQLSAQSDVTLVVNPAPVNQAPMVTAGAAQAITLPASAALAGAATDDGLPAGSTLGLTWTRVSGPGTVTFQDARRAMTTATFSAAGTYVLRLTATDGALSAQSDVTITVRAAATNAAPVVNAGAAQTITLPATATLSGTATDDGLPAGSMLSLAWSRVSGPGTVGFQDASRAMTTATFSAAGTYVLRLSATDGALSAQSDVTIIVRAAAVNTAPVVNAGTAQTITLPATATLMGSATDDGLPAGSTLSFTWTSVSGPGTVTFAAPSQAATTASFSVAGSYVLRLTASDGALQGSAQVTITVQSATGAPRNVLMFVAYNDSWWPEYKVMYEGLRAAGFTVDVRSSATGTALADYSAPVNVTPSAQPLDSAYPNPSTYAAFTTLYQQDFGQAWNTAWNAIATIPINGRLQDVTSMAGYEALVIPGGRGMIAYRLDGTYAASSPQAAPGTHITTAQEVQAAAERLAALAQEALQAGKPVAAQCHSAPTLAFVRIPGTTGQGFDGLGRSVLEGRYASGFSFSTSDTLARYQDLSVSSLRYEKVVIDGPEAPAFGGNGRDQIITTSDWYPETAAHATRTLINMLDTQPTPAQRTRAINVLVFGGDEPTLYAPDQPARYTDLVTLLNDPADDLNITATGTNNPGDMNLTTLNTYDALLYFRHDRITQAQQTAVESYVDGGGGLVALHHAVFNEGNAKGTIVNMIGAALPAAAVPNNASYLLYTNQTNRSINVNLGHFVSTYGVHLLSGQTTQSIPYTTARGYPNASLTLDAARGYWSFTIPANDEVYTGLSFNAGVSFGRGVGQLERLFSSDHTFAGSTNPQNGAYDAWGFAKRFNPSGDATVGRIVYFQPGETAARTLQNASYRQVVKNAAIWVAR